MRPTLSYISIFLYYLVGMEMLAKASSGLERSRAAALRVRRRYAHDFAHRTLARFRRLLDLETTGGDHTYYTVAGANRFADLLNAHNREHAGPYDPGAIPTRRGKLHWQAIQVVRLVRACGFPDLKSYINSFDRRTTPEVRHDITGSNYGRLLRAYVVEEGLFTLGEVNMGEEEYRLLCEILNSLAFNSDENPSYGPGHICNRRFKRYAAEHVIYLFDELRGEELTDLPAPSAQRSELRRLGIIGTRPGSEAERDPWATCTLALPADKAAQPITERSWRMSPGGGSSADASAREREAGHIEVDRHCGQRRQIGAR